MEFILTGNIVDIEARRIFQGSVAIKDGRILSVHETGNTEDPEQPYLLPGFIDSHVHIESSMLVPSEFARLAVVHGTIATVSDPHEIANVCGMQGVEYMIENGKTVPFKFFFGAPSCVPATSFETAGASLNADQVNALLQKDDILYLSEMMNFPGVLNGDEEVMKKIRSAKKAGKPVDGHAPGLTGDIAKKYIAAGISTDHECFTREEALSKLGFGMKVIIREGSAAKNFEVLADLLRDHSEMIMFCSDDKHPDSLVEGHINHLCARAIAKGIDVFNVLAAACINPVRHYRLPVGLLKPGDAADLVMLKDLRSFSVLRTFINGELVAENGKSKIKPATASVINNFDCLEKSIEDFFIPASVAPQPVIEALDGQLITNKIFAQVKIDGNALVSDTANDLIKIAVINRYANAPVSCGFIKNTGLKQGALASSVAHDSHNIVAIGVDDDSLCRAVNLIIRHKGGISCVKDNLEMVLPLPVAGLMSNEDGYRIAELYSLLDAAAKDAGSTLTSPFMTLSFMALLVIPHIKISDLGMFDGDEFRFFAGKSMPFTDTTAASA